MENSMKKLFSVFAIIILSASFFTTCKKDNGAPPTLPPQESFTIDFSNFASLKKSIELTSEPKGTNNSNWEFAALVAGYWRVITATTLAVPISAFKLALDNDPVFLSDNTWQWTYSVSPADVAYKARLTGQISSTDVIWKMYVTREGTGGFPEFLWFEGKSSLDATSGQWTLNQSSVVPEAVLQIDWKRTGVTVPYIKYTFLKNLDPFKTSTIEFGLKEATLNAYYTVHYYTGAKFSDVSVEWNTTAKNGRVKSSDYLDGKWFCWDENKLNNAANCPQ
jgi:hypothetical protein